MAVDGTIVVHLASNKPYRTSAVDGSLIVDSAPVDVDEAFMLMVTPGEIVSVAPKTVHVSPALMVMSSAIVVSDVKSVDEALTR
jgi:hypothetical protein